MSSRTPRDPRERRSARPAGPERRARSAGSGQTSRSSRASSPGGTKPATPRSQGAARKQASGTKPGSARSQAAARKQSQPGKKAGARKQPQPRKKAAPRAAQRAAAQERRPLRPARAGGVADPSRRVGWMLLGIVSVAFVFALVLADLQVVRGDEWVLQGEAQRTGTVELVAYRGSVTDRNGFVLASSAPSSAAVADPSMLKDPAVTAELLAPILGHDPEELAASLQPESEKDKYELLARHLDDDAVQQITDLRADGEVNDYMVGIFLEPDEDRIYPGDSLARPLVGLVDTGNVGVFGAEATYDAALQGSTGEAILERGAFGSISVGERRVTPAVDGSDVVFTIDHRIQFVAEQALVEQCEATGANGAQAVVTVPDTGEILAMATVVRDDEAGTCSVPFHNAALVTAFEPGSVLKPVTWAAAIEERGYHGDTLVDVPAEVEIGGETFSDPHPWVPAPYPLWQIAAESSNVGTIMVAKDLGNETIWSYLDAFGIGRVTGLDWKDEIRGNLRNPDQWHGSDAGSIPIGQGVTVNATQLAGVYATVANGGTYVSPMLVKETVDPHGNVGQQSVQTTRRVIAESTADELTRLLVGVTETGTGRRAAIPGYTVAGKTGTAWKVYENEDGNNTYGEEDSRRYVLTFAGFVPAEKPELAIVVVLDEPAIAGQAGALAAPAFRQIGEYGLRILGIPPAGEVDEVDGRVRGTPAAAPVSPLDETKVDNADASETDQADGTAQDGTTQVDTAQDGTAQDGTAQGDTADAAADDAAASDDVSLTGGASEIDEADQITDAEIVDDDGSAASGDAVSAESREDDG